MRLASVLIIQPCGQIWAGRGMWVGSQFKDHGKRMKVVGIGEVSSEGKERLIDVKAVEIEE